MVLPESPRPAGAADPQVLAAAGVRAERLEARLPGETRWRVPLTDLPAACQAVHQHLGAPLITVVGNDRRAHDGTFHLSYLFSVDAEQRWVAVEAQVPGDQPAFPAVTPVVTAAHWHEREIQDLFGLEAVGHPDPRRLVLHEGYPRAYHPLRKDVPAHIPPPVPAPHPFVYPRVEGEGVFDVPVGPIHAGVIEPGHFVFSGAGERILKLEARLFFTHRGIEKLAEGQPVAQGVFVAERICGVCAFSHSTAYVQAVEALAGTPAPPRAQAIRTLLLEFERLYNHIGDVGNICAGIGFAPGSSAGARLKERLQELNEVVTGHRFLRGINCVGGVRRELTNLPHAAAQLRVIKTEFAQMVDVMLNSDSVRQRLDGTGVLAAAVAEAFGAVGVAARASGSRRDSRIYHPHGLYPALAVQATTRQQGDVRARTEVRIQEAQQAFRLVAEVLDRLPDGPLTVPLGPLPAYHGALGRVESPRGETAHWVMVAPDGTIYRYRVRSAPYANWPVVPFAVPGNMVPDFPLINKSFELCYACCDR